MRRAELLLTQVQRATENERGSGTADGISPEEYYQYFTDGLRMIQRAIMGANDKAFRTFLIFSADGTEDYDLPFDFFARNSIATLEYSPSGNARDYYKLEKRTQLERFSDTGSPSQYIMEAKRILVNAYPASGSFRMTYTALLPAVDKRRATVASKTLSAGGVLSALTLAITSPFTAADFALYDHICIVDFNGSITCRKIPYTAVNSGTGIVTIQGTTYASPSGSSIAVGDYVCLGEYATTHFQIDDQAEDFLLAYCQKRIFNRDSSSDAVEMSEEMKGMLQAIISVYADDSDVDEVPITNYNYFDDLG